MARRVGVAALAWALSATLLAQTPTIDVATIKRNSGLDSRQSTRILPGGRIEITNMPLKTMVRVAFGITSAQVAGGPAWMTSDGYDIVAKVTGDPAAALKALLEDRFQLRVHKEMREAQTFALVVANGGALGPQLHPSQADCSPAAVNQCGIRGGGGNITYTGLTTAQIAASIAGFSVIGTPVVDRTGLAGRYDLHLEFNDDSGPNVFTALVEQAGLKLHTEKSSIEYVVVDRAERPGEN
jgi:uncharacterized protein (TIGR03435 family)